MSLSAVAARDKYVKIAAAARRSSAVRMPGSVWSEWHGGPVGSCVGNGGRRLLFAGTACVSPVGSLSLSPDRNRICYGKSKTIHRRASGTFRRRAFLAAAHPVDQRRQRASGRYGPLRRASARRASFRRRRPRRGNADRRQSDRLRREDRRFGCADCARVRSLRRDAGRSARRVEDDPFEPGFARRTYLGARGPTTTRDSRSCTSKRWRR